MTLDFGSRKGLSKIWKFLSNQDTQRGNKHSSPFHSFHTHWLLSGRGQFPIANFFQSPFKTTSNLRCFFFRFHLTHHGFFPVSNNPPFLSALKNQHIFLMLTPKFGDRHGGPNPKRWTPWSVKVTKFGSRCAMSMCLGSRRRGGRGFQRREAVRRRRVFPRSFFWFGGVRRKVGGGKLHDFFLREVSTNGWLVDWWFGARWLGILALGHGMPQNPNPFHKRGIRTTNPNHQLTFNHELKVSFVNWRSFCGILKAGGVFTVTFFGVGGVNGWMIGWKRVKQSGVSSFLWVKIDWSPKCLEPKWLLFLLEKALFWGVDLQK